VLPLCPRKPKKKTEKIKKKKHFEELREKSILLRIDVKR